MDSEGAVVVGTAGHVDHGKTTLVHALTGADTDRLPEEKQRRISIDLGFAPLSLPGGREVGLVDVPGHERFIRNMVAGATGIDLVLLVVAADEGVMPQTREHLDIFFLLGLGAGVVAVTKKDLVDEAWLELVLEDIREAVTGTFLEGAALVPVSAVTGEGLEELKSRLAEATLSVRPRGEAGFARLPIDRSFSVPGFGTVVTGTLQSGGVKVDDRLDLLPSGVSVRVRQVQVHGKPVERVAAGRRAALNLTGIEKNRVRRGDVLATPGSLDPTRSFAAHLHVLSRAARPVRNEERVRLHVGTAEVIGRILLLDREELAPGDDCFIQFKAEKPLTVARADRFIVRTYSPVNTIGGGVILDTSRRFKRYNAQGLEELAVMAAGDPASLLETVLRGRGPVHVPEVAGLVGMPVAEMGPVLESLASEGRLQLIGGEYAVAMSDYNRLRERLGEILADFRRRHPLRRGLAREELRAALWPGLDVRGSNALLQRLADEGMLRLDREMVAPSGGEPALTPPQEAARCVIEDAFRLGGMAPPAPEEALASGRAAGSDADEVLNLLVDRGVLVKVAEDIYFHAAVLEEAGLLVRRHLEETGSMTMAEMRDLLGTTRKYAVPLGEYFDRIRLTRRQGDRRRLALKAE